MSEDEKKKKKKKAIIAGIIGSVALIGGGIGGTIAAIPETEAKNEEENQEEKKKRPIPNPKSQPILKIDLQTTLTQDKRYIGTIETNGALKPTEQQIKDKLPANIQNEVDIKIIDDTKATLIAKTNSNYTGTIEVTYTVDKSVELSTAFTNLNLGTIETNGALKPTEQQIKDKLPANIQNEVDIKIIDDTKATLIAKTNSNYTGTIEVTYNVDTKKTLKSALSQDNIGTIETNGALKPTEQQIKDKLPANIQNEVDIKIIDDTKATLIAKTNSNYTGTIEVTYTVDKSVELSTAFTNLNLGTIETNGALKPTEQQIKDKLPANIQNEVDIKIIDDTKATLIPKTNSNYTGTIEVTYTVDKSVELSTAFTNLNLGTIETNGASKPTEQQIKDKLEKIIKDKSKTNIKNINFIKIENESAKIEYRYKSLYKGEVTVTYTLDTKQILETTLASSQRNLGTIATNGQALTVNMIKAKLQANIQNEVDIKIIDDTKATLIAKTNSNYTGTIEVTYNVDTKKTLKSALSQDNIGTIETNGALKPTEQQIKDKLPANIQNEVDIKIIDDTKATLIAKTNSNYKGTIEVTYNVDTKKTLKSALSQDNIGTIETNGALKPTEQQIKDKLPANIQNEVDIKIIDDTKATLIAKTNSNYTGTIEVTYTVDKSVELSTAFTNLNLGTIETNGASKPTEQQIKDKLEKIIKDKSKTNIKNINFIKIENESAKIEYRYKSLYKGEVTVTYTLDTKQILETTLASSQRNLGTIATNGQALTVNMIKAKLQANIQNEVDIKIIDDTKATLIAKTNSNYKGTIEVTYNVDTKKTLKSALSQDNIGTIETNGALKPTEQQIKDKLPANIQNEVDIKIIDDTKATLIAKTNSNYKGTIEVTYNVDKSVELSTAFTNLNLGTIETNGASKPTEQQIKDKLEKIIKDKSKTNIKNINFIKIENESAKIEYRYKSLYKGEVTVTYTVDKSVELSTAFTNLNLGTIETNGALKPTEQQIKDKLEKIIKDKSKTNIKNINFIKIENESAKIEYRYKSLYKGEVTVTYTVDKSVELSTAFTNLNLGTIETNGASKPTEQQIKDKLEKIIKDKSKTNIKSINFIKIENESAKIEYRYKSLYKGEVTVTYTLDTKQILETTLASSQRNLGTIATNGQALTVNMIKAKLQANIQNEVDIKIIDDTKATLIAKTNSNYKGTIEVTYNVDTKKTLKSAISQDNIGTIETNGALKPTEQQIKDKLPANIQNEVDIKIIDDTKATLIAKTNSNYTGTIEVTYTVDKSVELSTAFTNLNLGTIETNGASKPTEQQIKDKLEKIIKDKSKTNIKSINFIKIENESAKIEYRYKSLYKGEVTVTYTLDTKQILETTLASSQRNLGTIATNGQALTVNMIKAKLQANIQNEVDIKIIDDTKATLIAKTNSNYKGTIEVTYNVDTKKTLKSALSQDNIGTIETNGALKPTEQQIKDKLPANIQNEVDIKIIDDTKAILIAKTNSNYKGTIEVTYNVDTKKTLKSALSQDNIGTIETNGALKPTEQQIKDKLPANIQNEVDIKIIDDTKATLIAKTNSNYKGTIEVTYTVDKSVELSTAFTNLNLGTIETNGASKPTEQQIKDKLEKIIKDKSKTNIKNINFIKIENESAKIEYRYKSLYKGEVTVTYTLDTKQILETTLASSQRNLGTIATNGQALTVNMIKAKLQANIQNEVDIKIIDDTKATLIAKTNSNYKGTIEVTYTVDKSVELSTAFTNLNLGTIETNGALKPTEQQIKDKLQANIQNEVDIKIIDYSKATLIPKTNSNYKGTIEVTYTLDKRENIENTIKSFFKNKSIIVTRTSNTEKIEKEIKSQFYLPINVAWSNRFLLTFDHKKKTVTFEVNEVMKRYYKQEKVIIKYEFKTIR